MGDIDVDVVVGVSGGELGPAAAFATARDGVWGRIFLPGGSFSTLALWEMIPIDTSESRSRNRSGCKPQIGLWPILGR